MRGEPDFMRLTMRLTWMFVFAVLSMAPVMAEDGHREESHRNNVGVFLGVTGEDRRDRAGTLALEYSRWFDESFGIGGVVEYAFGDLDFLVLAVPLAYRVDAWKFYAGPGVEMEERGDTEFLFRIGGEYAFEVGERTEVAPQVNLDFVDGDTVVVFGVLVAYGF